MEKFERSVAFFKEGKFEEALEIINACITSDSNNSEFYFFRARVLTRLGKLGDSLSDFDYLHNLEPFNPTYIADRAVVLHLLRRNEEALAEFDRALNLEPNNPYRYSSRAYFKDRIGDHKGAIEDYEKAIELDPEDAVAYNNKGLVEEKMGYINKSKKSFEKSDELIGYKKKEPTNEKQFSKPVTKKEEPRVEIEPMSPRPTKITAQSYFKTLQDVIIDKKVRADFWGFIKSKLWSREP